ncbi:MAG TPA: asparagine synthase (glutamine-hydrolyzing) [Pelolinea sp.]|nr:asparagine synthase (glutamine-hydrolyzing) [Pelolinea sp.]
MCGITGLINFNGEPASQVILKKMTDVIAHRGPEGEGFYINDTAGLGHRRLKIIDLSPAGSQPMITRDKRYVISYNGEVYNFGQLRVELEALGHEFHSRSDTEVILHGFAEWGIEVVHKLNGMFAFAILDNHEHILWLARDRYGVKPIYYYQDERHFIFASEVKAILAHPGYQIGVDKEACLEYFTFQNNFTDRTLFKDIRLFPAGSFMRIDISQNPKITTEKFWDFSFAEPDSKISDQEYLEELDRLINQAVNRQLVSDVDVGAYLSGGMDSGTITALAARQLPYLKTFTCGFDMHSSSGIELTFDEREKAEMMSYQYKTEHYEIVLKAGDMERVMPKLAWHLEEPRMGQSYPNYYAAQLAGKFVKVVLSGGGGDEMFGGYPWRYYRAVINNNFEDYIDKYYQYWQRLIPNKEIQKVFQPIWTDVSHVWTRDIFRDVFINRSQVLDSPEDYIKHSLYFEARTFLHGLLVVEDKLSMAHSLETRVPFLDNDLVDFAMRLPASLILENLTTLTRMNENEIRSFEKYQAKTNDGKKILRKIMSQYIPKEITSATKQGFSAPDASWFKGDSIDYVNRVIMDKKAAMYDYLDCNSVQSLVNEHLHGERNRRLLIWSLLSFEWWLKTFLS